MVVVCLKPIEYDHKFESCALKSREEGVNRSVLTSNISPENESGFTFYLISSPTQNEAATGER